LVQSWEVAWHRYGELEAAALGAQLGALRLPAAGEDAEAAVLALASAAAAAGAAAGAALERCRRVTGGTALPDARAVVDRELAQLAVRMQARAALSPSAGLRVCQFSSC